MDGQMGESDPLPGSALDASPPPPDVPPPDTLPRDTLPADTLPRDTLSPDVVRPASPLGPNCVGLPPWQDGTSYQPGRARDQFEPSTSVRVQTVAEFRMVRAGDLRARRFPVLARRLDFPRPLPLVIRPFHQQSLVVSIREFTNNAMNHHHGMQSVERFGRDTDPYGDGFKNE